MPPCFYTYRVVPTCVCGSNLWFYRGQSEYTPRATPGCPVGHEFLGIVEQIGDGVKNIAKSELVIAQFLYCDGTCPNCKAAKWPYKYLRQLAS